MMRVCCVLCCAVLVAAAASCPAIGVADDNPFGEGVNVAQLVQAEPTPTEVLPADPALGGEIALPAMIEKPAPESQDFCNCVGEDTVPSVERIRRALGSPLKPSGLDFTDLALSEAIAVLQDEYGIPIKLDTAALNDLSIQPDQAINVHLHDISLHAALHLMLKEIGLTYIIQDEVLMITSADEAEKQLKVCVYDVRDLIEPSKKADMDTLRDTIASCVATETWAVNGGGEAEIRPLSPGLLVISQTQPVHDEVRALLDTIRRQLHVAPAAAAAAASRPAVPRVAAADNANVVTRSYYLSINQQPGGESFASKIRELITLSLPDEQWDGRLANGDPVVLIVLPDRVVVRHNQAVQDKVQSLLSDSGIASPPNAVAGVEGGAMGGGGFGGGGGGFFNPQPAESQ